MNHFIALRKGRPSTYVKLMSNIQVFTLPADLDNPRCYDCNYKLDDDEWFFIDEFSTKNYCIKILTEEFNSTEYNQIAFNDYSKLTYLCSYQNERYYFFQKVNSTQIVRKRWIKFSLEPSITEEPILLLKEFPDAIFDKQEDILYFKNLHSLTSIFKGIEVLYKEATDEETTGFLNEDFVNLTEDYNCNKVKSANRKRISMVLETLSKFSDKQKSSIYKYIAKYCKELEFDPLTKKFNIKCENSLKQLLYGIEQRYYTTAVGKENRIANSVIKMP